MLRVILTTTSFQDTRGPHQDLLKRTGWEIVRARGPLNEADRLALAGKSDRTTTPPIQRLTMPAMRTLRNDEAIAAALTFRRRSVGHTANPVAPATVAAARIAVADKPDNFNNASVDQLVRQFAAQPRAATRGATP